MPGSAQPDMDGLTPDYIEQIAAGKSGIFTDEERADSLKRYHDLYGCIVCGSRRSGCTAERCTRQEFLEKAPRDVLDRFTERCRESYHAGVTEIIRRSFAHLDEGEDDGLSDDS